MTAHVQIWHKAPFIRLFIALAAGILVQWNFNLPILLITTLLFISSIFILVYSFTPIGFKFKAKLANGICYNILVFSLGALLLWINDIRNDPQWIGYKYQQSGTWSVVLKEPLVEKENTFKAIASVQNFYSDNVLQSAAGQIIIYFKKDASVKELQYGSQIVFNNKLQEIRNAGNPGAFDYKQYAFFEGYTHQVYLTSKDYAVLPELQQSAFWRFIFDARQWVLSHLKTYIGKREQGLAEAILIGYKNDLDKNLVQAYSNTGVVHIIAISGLHLGLIYAIVLFLTRPLKRRNYFWSRLAIIIISLWLFSILAGAQPSVLRAAVMFSFVAVGEVLGKKTAIYNTLALSAFLLLCHNPYFLWDVGFQLSYAAVLSIVTFFRPVYNWLLFENKAVDFFWKIAAVTISAQLLTLPISIYHFHQAPILFLLSNIIAVPLGSLILISEIILCALFWFPSGAHILGIVVTFFISIFNNYIEAINRISFSVWNSLSITTYQAFLLLIFTIGFCFYFLEKQKVFLRISAASLVVFLAIRSYSFLQANHQQRLIVYNVPKHLAIDVINNRTYSFFGSEKLLEDGFERNFHLQPSRILHRVNNNNILPVTTREFAIAGKQLVIIDSTTDVNHLPLNTSIDLMIISGNPKLYLSKLTERIKVKQIIIAGSVPGWKAKRWQKDADSLQVPCFNVSEKGAFVKNVR